MRRTTTARRTSDRGVVEGYRSGLEEKVAEQLAKRGIKVTYEEHFLRYVKPSKPSRYTPDFILPNGIIVETKGRFVTADRQKHLHVRADHPGLDIRFVFSNPNTRIGKTSTTTYAMWCDKFDFQYATKWVPEQWLEEPPELTRVIAAGAAMGWKPQ